VRTAPGRDVARARRLQISLAKIAGGNRTFIASAVSAHAQSDWTGVVSSNWFLSGNWIGGVPRLTTNANIDTVTPNSTAISSSGAQAQNLGVGQSGTGTLTIQTGGTLNTSFGAVGNLPGSLGRVTVTVPAPAG
jgi:T5SS/PEP-CTERM-associated repeat protein